MTNPGQAPEQQGLWGAAEPVPVTPKAARRAVHDMDLLASVVKSAIDPGYVLIGPAERVYLRDPTRDGAVDPVPVYEADAVVQLLSSGHLKVGGAHRVRTAGREGHANAVLVPRDTKLMVRRWDALAPLGGRPPRQRTGGSPSPGTTAGRLWCPECGEPAVARPPTRWTPANGPRPHHSHPDGEPLCPVLTATGYRPALPTTRRPT